MQKRWQFWIDRGGTFTDVVAQTPTGEILTHKLLSENPEHYRDAAVQGIRDLMQLEPGAPIPQQQIAVIKMGTTVATNALLERKGDRTLLLISKGFRDAIRIAYQNRPDLFALNIQLPEMLYERVIEIDERVGADGNMVTPLNLDNTIDAIKQARADGISSCAVVFMHGYRFPQHEQSTYAAIKDLGFQYIALSHKISPLIKLVGRGDTTLVDAYLAPILFRYIDQLKDELGNTRIEFMQSNGGLTSSDSFMAKDSILSGPAGGVVGVVETAKRAGFNRIIGFDMGGTSTDVSHYAGKLERSYETLVSGARIRVPMLDIHTIAAGGGSILSVTQGRFQVGPESAGANPGPACYRRGGPLTVTDCNVQLGKIQPQFFPSVFGKQQNQPLDTETVNQQFTALAKQLNTDYSANEVAEGFLNIAVLNMANAIRKISVQRGHDITQYTLCSFGGAGGQHACLIADELGISTIMLHPYAGVLSAYGMGLAKLNHMEHISVEKDLQNISIDELEQTYQTLQQQAESVLLEQGLAASDITSHRTCRIKYLGTDVALELNYSPDVETLKIEFTKAYENTYGFSMPDKPLVIELLSVEASSQQASVEYQWDSPKQAAAEIQTVSMYSQGKQHQAHVYQRDELASGQVIKGPALITEKTGTNVIEPGWQVSLNDHGDLVLERHQAKHQKALSQFDKADPIYLEVFNNLFMAIAEQMGEALKNTAYSVNIKERLDYSCALFDRLGNLVANAPHIPVHLGSMSHTIKYILQERRGTMRPGDVYLHNDPYHGGTHLPDMTAVTPFFIEGEEDPLFYVASRGHHADIGGTTPGSMPANSKKIAEEGALATNVQIVKQHEFLESVVRSVFLDNEHPARNITQNLADLKAQIAANKSGISGLDNMLNEYGRDVVEAYTQFVQDNAEECVREVISNLKDGEFTASLDSGATVKVKVSIDSATREAVIDFRGSSGIQDSNFNAPTAITTAACLYVFRTLVTQKIPLNEGCLKPIKILLDDKSFLNPCYPAAVVAGNVETSQWIVESLYTAMGIIAESQGTTNNFTFGDDKLQYYETVGGGYGAGPSWHGASGVQVHITNSLLTDPEVLEMKFPVLLQDFHLRTGSGGKGKFNGGDGLVRKMTFLQGITANILSTHRRVQPRGLAGGEPALAGKNYVVRKDGRIDHLDYSDQTEMEAGDTFVIETPGGGGYGSLK